MGTIYLKIKIKKSDTETEEIRNEGIFFENIADALCLERDAIIEIDETNYKQIIKEINKKFSKYDTKNKN
ncbi:MAG: hypothetical protein D6799_02385 [Bacteroidetes bacterium]|nr:MAG: hypothetical protein D6799_02385 [Bacteroidota bacterium]